MQELVGAIASFSGVIEKGGIIAVMMIMLGMLAKYCWSLKKLLAVVYRQRDRSRLIQIRYKGALDNAKITVDVSDIDRIFQEDRMEEVA